MEMKKFRDLFSMVGKDFTVSLLAKPGIPLKNCARIKSSMKIFDALELLKEHDCLVTENGLVVTRKAAMGRSVRVLFFILIIEVEYAVYKILKQYASQPGSLENLRSIYLNDMIRELLSKPELLGMQGIYSKKQQMKEDLKAVSSFRNIIMHSNRKMELETEFEVILKRKEQLLRLLSAFEQITENLKVKNGKWV